MAAAAAAVPSLRQNCLHVLASALLACQQGGQQQASSSSSSSRGSLLLAGIQALPQELQLELLLVLAGWQLLDAAACKLLTGGGSSGASSSSGSSSSILSGASNISLAGCVLLHSASLAPLFCCPLPQLRTLSLKGLLWLTDADVAVLTQQCPNLRNLDLSKCPQLTAAAVQAVAATPAAPQLQALNLAACWQVAALPGLAAACTQLVSLNLSGCWQLTTAAVRQVLSATGLLEELSLSGCSQLDAGILVEASVPAMLPPAPPAQQQQQQEQQQEQQLAPHAGAAGQQQLQLLPPAAAAGLLGAPEGREGGRHAGAEVEEVEEEENVEEAARKLCFPVAGVALPQLRSLDLSGTAADDCLLFWLAQRCCCRLQKLVLGNTQVTGLGIAAVLAAKRALLHHQRCISRQRSSGSTFEAAAVAAAAVTAAGDVLPLLELAVGGTAAFGDAALQYALPTQLLQAVQRQWEARQGGGLLLHSPSGGSGGSSGGGGVRSSSRACLPLLVSLLAAPADATCPYCPAAAVTTTRSFLAASHLHPGALAPAEADSAAAEAAWWPPDSPAEVLAALGPQGLGQLQALDVSGSGGTSALAEVVAAHCSSLQRLRLAGCTGLSDASLAQMLDGRMAALRDLDVSGCTGSRVSRPGSRFLRHKAPRLQQGGVTDATLCLLPTRCCPCQQQQQEQQQRVTADGEQQDTAAAAPSSAAAAAAATGGLQALNLSGLSATDATLSCLSGLTSLQLRGCKRVTNSGLLQLLAQCPGLARLDAAGCSQLTAAGFGCYTPFSQQPPQPGAAAQQEQQQHVAQQQQQQQGWQWQPGALSGQRFSGAASAGRGWEEQPQPVSASASPQQQQRQQRQQHASGLTYSSSSSSSSAEQVQAPPPPQQEQQQQQVALFGHVVSTAAAVQLQLAALPKPACTREVLAWLAGQAGSSGGGSSSGGSSSSGPAGFSPLQRLELASCSTLTEADLLALAACCPQLKALQLGAAAGAAAASSRLCEALGQRCRLLARVSIDGGASLADADLALLLRQLPALQHLSLTGCCSITGAVVNDWQAGQEKQHPLAPAAAACGGSGRGGGSSPQGHPEAAAAAAAEAGSRGCFMLRTLRLDGCSIGDASSAALAASCHHLELLSLRHCRQISSTAAVAVLAACRNLRQLLLGGSGVAECCHVPTCLACFATATAAGGPAVFEHLSHTHDASLVPPGTPPAALLAVELPVQAKGAGWLQLLGLLTPLGSISVTYRD